MNLLARVNSAGKRGYAREIQMMNGAESTRVTYRYFLHGQSACASCRYSRFDILHLALGFCYQRLYRFPSVQIHPVVYTYVRQDVALDQIWDQK